MLRFVFHSPPGKEPLRDLPGAHLVGNDGVPVRGEIKLGNNEIRCETRSTDPVGLSLLWPVEGFGAVQLQTTRLPSRSEPYHLNLELVRHQLMRISLKREEWGLFDYSGMDDIAQDIGRARDLFIQGLETIEDTAGAARAANESLGLAIRAGERLAQFHATVFLNRRQQSGGFNKACFGVVAPTSQPTLGMLKTIGEAFDFVRLPFVWRQLQPTEQGNRFEIVEAWLKSLGSSKLQVRGGPLLHFGVQSVPDWMYIWENDFESIHDAARDFISRTVQRFGKQVSTWIVASGLHADNVFSFSFEQVMELTRMATTVTKQLAPRAQVLIDLTQPWGEYYARSAQTIPPLLYADMVMQSGINFDGFGLQFLFGINSDGYHVRDLLQISALIDKLANLGKPLHISAIAAPSTPIGGGPISGGGEWLGPWSESLQSDWLNACCEIALSKPYVEGVCLQYLTDNSANAIATGGLLREDGGPKPAFAKLAALHRRLRAEPSK